MASLGLTLGAAVTGGRVFPATGGSKEEKSFLDWILGNLTKQDQFYETDPILKKVPEKPGTTGGGGRKGGNGTVSVPGKKNGGGFGGLFAKK